MAAGKKKTILNPPAPKANSLTGPKTKPASNSLNRVPVVRKQQHAGTSGKKEERGVEKSTGGEKNQRTGNEGEKKTKEFSRIRSKTWEKEEFEASKNVGKRNKENDEHGRKMEGRKEEENDGKNKAETKGGGWKDKRSDESMKNEKITVSDQRERNRMERKEDKEMEYLNIRNEEEEEVEEEVEEEIGMNNREQIEPAEEDADLQDKYSDDFEDYDSDFEEEGEDEESFVGVTGSENARNSRVKKDGMEEEEAENIDERKDDLSVVGYERKNVFSRDERDWKEVLGMKEEDMRSEKKVRIEEVRGEKEEVQGKEEERRIDSKWRESDLEVNPFPIDSSRIKRINDRNQGRLTCITYHVYESPPLNYDLFIRLFGRKHTKQVEIQTRERNDISCQSDVCSFKEKSCQFPNYISSLETGGKEEDSTQSSFSWKDRGGLRSDPFKLRLFLLKAEQVINLSLERRFTSGRSQQQRSKSAKRLLNVPPSVQGFCTQFYKLIPPPFHTFSSSNPFLSSSSSSRTRSSHTRSSISSPSSSSSSKLGVQNMTYDSSYLISCQTSKHEGGEGGGEGGLREESFISLWSLKDTDKGAEYLFRTRTVVTCLASDHRTTIYAGSSDGSITLWDIRESTSSSSSSSTLLSSTFQSVTEANPVIKSVRGPSFTTACSSIPVTHSHPVTGLSLFKRNELSNCFPRLCSVDEEGLIILWMYQEDSTSTSFTSSTSVPDLMDGMFPGSRIKLIQETSIRVPGNEFSIKTMVTSSYDPFTFFLGTSLGQVIRVSKFSQDGEQKSKFSQDGEQKSPQIYFEQGEETFSAVTCITFNPKMLTHFLVSFEDGTICLFSENKNQPLLTWDPSDLQISTVISVQWFPESGTSFAALASSSTILIWNLTSNLTNPSLKFQMTRYLTLFLSSSLSLPLSLSLSSFKSSLSHPSPREVFLTSLSLSLLTFLPFCTHFLVLIAKFIIPEYSRSVAVFPNQH